MKFLGPGTLDLILFWILMGIGLCMWNSLIFNSAGTFITRSYLMTCWEFFLDFSRHIGFLALGLVISKNFLGGVKQAYSPLCPPWFADLEEDRISLAGHYGLSRCQFCFCLEAPDIGPLTRALLSVVPQMVMLSLREWFQRMSRPGSLYKEVFPFFKAFPCISEFIFYFVVGVSLGMALLGEAQN